MPNKRLTRQQQSALQKIADMDLYTADSGFRTVTHDAGWSVPARSTLYSLWRRGMFEITPDATVTDSGQNLGHMLRLTTMGRYELRESQPKTFTTSWRVNIAPGTHARKRTPQLKSGDLILMSWTDGRKEWRRIVDIKPWLTSMPDWREFTTEDTDGRDSTTHVHSGTSRWTVQAAPETTEGT